MIERNTPIEIYAVANGYVVAPAFRPNSQPATTVAVADSRLLVFESQPALLQWPVQHFDLPTPAC